MRKRLIALFAIPAVVGNLIEVPFGAQRGPLVRRDPRFLDLRDEIQDHLRTNVR